MRITTKIIESLAKILNENTRNSTEEWTDGKANEGHYKLNYAYDSVELQRITSPAGSCTVICGYCSTREMYFFLKGCLTFIDKKVNP